MSGHVLGGHLLIGDLLGPDHDLDGLGAQPLAAAFLEDDLALQASLFSSAWKGRRDFFTPHGQTAGAATDENLGLLRIPAA